MKRPFHKYPGIALLSDSVDFVDEDDAGRLFSGLFEELSHALGANARVEFDEVRPAHVQKRHFGFARRRFGQKGLAGAGGTAQEGPAGDARADVEVFVLVLHEVDELHDFGLRFVDAGDVLEVHARVLDHVDLRVGVPTHHLLDLVYKVALAGEDEAHGVVGVAIIIVVIVGFVTCGFVIVGFVTCGFVFVGFITH